jgi:hypothetical protein
MPWEVGLPYFSPCCSKPLFLMNTSPVRTGRRSLFDVLA